MDVLILSSLLNQTLFPHPAALASPCLKFTILGLTQTYWISVFALTRFLIPVKFEKHCFVLFFNKCIYLFMAAFGLHCYMRAFSSCGERGLPFLAVHRLLIVVASRCRAQAWGARASVVVAFGLSSCGSQALERRLSSCGAQTQLLRGMWDLPRPGLEPVSPALAGGFLTTAPPGKPWEVLF